MSVRKPTPPSSPAPAPPAPAEIASSPLSSVVIVGPGRLGSALAAALLGVGVKARLVGRGAPIPPADLTLLTVPDRAIAEAASAVPPGGVLLHTSGATDLSPLRPRAPVGSFHPLMTFPGGGAATALQGVPVALAGDPPALAAGRALAERLEMCPFEVPGDRRLYHAAAVLAGNFSTVLIAVASQALAQAGVPADQAPALLAPLALASIQNAARLGPAQALTGPVARGDLGVLQGHQEALRADLPEVATLYDALLVEARRLARQQRP